MVSGRARLWPLAILLMVDGSTPAQYGRGVEAQAALRQQLAQGGDSTLHSAILSCQKLDSRASRSRTVSSRKAGASHHLAHGKIIVHARRMPDLPSIETW